jgi:hypothetical protein
MYFPRAWEFSGAALNCVVTAMKKSLACACALHEFRGGTVCGVGAEGFASFPGQTDKGLEE